MPSFIPLISLTILTIILSINAYDPSELGIKGFRIGECKAWVEFRKKYHKRYTTLAEFRKRKFIFISNYRRIKEHNKKYDVKLETFNCTINSYSDLTREEFLKKFTGLTGYNATDLSKFQVRGVGNGRIVAGHRRIMQEAKILEAIDWRRTAVTKVERQGECGSCWAFAAAGAFEGQIFKKLQKLVQVSVQYFLDCVQTNETTGCTGGLMTDAYKFAMSNGVIASNSLPYEAVETRDGCPDNLMKIPIKVDGFIELATLSEADLQRIVSTIGPISIGIDARWQSMQFYEFGVYFEPRCDPNELNHAVLVVGYGTDAELGDYWIVKNSWGSAWGEHGYVRMARNKNNHCGIATMPSYPIVSKSLTT